MNAESSITSKHPSAQSEQEKRRAKKRKQLNARFMNRAQRRLAAKAERLTGGVILERSVMQELTTATKFLHAIIKSQGRVRITDEELESLKEGDRVTMRREGGACVLSYAGSEAAAESEPEAA